MRLIWKKRWGFTVISYPVDQEENLFRVGVYDGNGDLWWYSETSSSNEQVLEEEACKGWIDILTDFGKRHETFPSNQSVLEAQKDIGSEIQVTRVRLQELLKGEFDELSGSDDGDGTGTGTGGKEDSQEETSSDSPLDSGGTETYGDPGGEADGRGGDPTEPSSEAPEGEHLDSEEGADNGEGSPEEGDSEHSEAPDKSEDSNQETGAVTG